MKYPKCEVCGKRRAISFSYIDNNWKYTCKCTSEYEKYYIYLFDRDGYDAFFSKTKTPGTNWIWHLETKSWYNE